MRLGDKAGNRTIRSRSLPLVDRLNDLARLPRTPELRVDGNRIVAEGRVVIDVLPGDVTKGDVQSTAQEWRHSIAEALKQFRAERR